MQDAETLPVTCPNGHAVEAGAAFCPNCGAKVDGQRCPRGHLVDSGATFCPHCGDPLEGGRPSNRRPLVMAGVAVLVVAAAAAFLIFRGGPIETVGDLKGELEASGLTFCDPPMVIPGSEPGIVMTAYLDFNPGCDDRETHSNFVEVNEFDTEESSVQAATVALEDRPLEGWKGWRVGRLHAYLPPEVDRELGESVAGSLDAIAGSQRLDLPIAAASAPSATTTTVPATASTATSSPPTESADAPTSTALPANDLSGLSISVGSKDFDEQLVLGQVVIQALEAQGADVVDQTDLGGTAVVRDALTAGTIDVYVEYTGTGYFHVDGSGFPSTDPNDLFNFVSSRDLKENEVRWLGMSQFSNAYGFAAAPAVMERNGSAFTFDSMAEFLQREPSAVVCVGGEFAERDDGLVLFEEYAGYEIPDTQLSTMQTGEIYHALAENRCSFGEVFTTDARLYDLDLELVEDPGVMIPFHASVTIRDELYSQRPEVFDATLADLFTDLDEHGMAYLNSLAVAGQTPASVAAHYLSGGGPDDTATVDCPMQPGYKESEQSARCLYQAWVAGDRDLALVYATQEAVDAMWPPAGSDPGWEWNGCSPTGDGYIIEICSWFIPDDFHGVLVEMSMAGGASAGQSVDSVDFFG